MSKQQKPINKPSIKPLSLLKTNHGPLSVLLNSGSYVPPDCEILIVQLGVGSRDKGLKREVVVNTNTESVKLDLFHKHIKKDTTEISPHVFQRCFFKTDIEAKEWLING